MNQPPAGQRMFDDDQIDKIATTLFAHSPETREQRGSTLSQSESSDKKQSVTQSVCTIQ